MFQGIAKKQQPYFKFDPLIDSLFTNEETGLCTEALEPIKAREGPFTFRELICIVCEISEKMGLFLNVSRSRGKTRI